MKRRSIKTYSLQFIAYSLILVSILASRPASAITGPIGASNLEQGDWGYSFLLGLDMPEAMFYGMRLDYGIFDRWQLGVATTYSGVYLGGGLNTRLMLFQSESEEHRFGLDGTTGFFRYWFWGDQLGMYLSPMAFYDFQFGFLNENSLYVKGGIATVYTDIDEANFMSFFTDRTRSNRWIWSTALTGKLGYQREITERVNFMVEGGLWYDIRVFQAAPRFQLGISYSW